MENAFATQNMVAPTAPCPSAPTTAGTRPTGAIAPTLLEGLNAGVIKDLWEMIAHSTRRWVICISIFKLK